jgi:RNA polymerase sigma factor (sigma-70 family)
MTPELFSDMVINIKKFKKVMHKEPSAGTVYSVNDEMRRGIQFLVSILKDDMSDNAAFTKLFSKLKTQTGWIRDHLVLDGHDDFDQFAMMVLMNAIKTYDKNRGSFMYYYFMTLKGRLFAFMRSHEHKINVFHYGMLRDIPNIEIDGEQMKIDESDSFKRIMSNANRMFTPVEKTVFDSRADGQTYDSIAEISGFDHKKIDNALMRAKGKIKAAMAQW